MLQVKQSLVKLAIQFIMAYIQIVQKLQVYIISQFVGYKDGEIEAHQKVHKATPTKLLQKSKKVHLQIY